MQYEKIKTIKESPKSTVQLVKQADGNRVFVRKILEGQHDVYLALKSCSHPYLPPIYDVSMSDHTTTIVEEYIDGQSLGADELSEKQICEIIKELCSVLEYLHKRDIIHRDIKPSNIMLADDGHIRLIDFDAARISKDDLEQDTRLLGTRGYAPPEQYGFAQTDARTDIYALGVTVKQLLGDRARKLRYRKMIQKCTNLNPDERYQNVQQVRKALFYGKYGYFYCAAAVCLVGLLCSGIWLMQRQDQAEIETAIKEDAAGASEENAAGEPQEAAASAEEIEESDGLIVLEAPDSPHWNGETGVAIWGNVPESGIGEVGYHWRLYRRDTLTPPDPETDAWDYEGNMRGDGAIDEETGTYSVNLSYGLQENGFYYFAVSADGDQMRYASSPYVISDAFEYTGEDAPQLPAPADLEWRMYESEDSRVFYATWSNLDDYADGDTFDVTVYDKDGNYVMNNTWEKEYIEPLGYGGIRIRPEFLSERGGKYRFTVEVYSSRPNEYKSFVMPDPIPEEYYSPWYAH